MVSIAHASLLEAASFSHSSVYSLKDTRQLWCHDTFGASASNTHSIYHAAADSDCSAPAARVLVMLCMADAFAMGFTCPMCYGLLCTCLPPSIGPTVFDLIRVLRHLHTDALSKHPVAPILPSKEMQGFVPSQGKAI